MKNPMAKWEMITPKKAAALLSNNPGNRIVRSKRVRRYARDMRLGRWKPNGVPIIIAQSGALRDGQHRLHAVVESGMTVMMLVVRGVEEDCFDTIDKGLSRSYADTIRSRDGAPRRVERAAVRRAAWQYARRDWVGSAIPSEGDLDLVAETCPRIDDSAEYGCAGFKPMLPKSPAGFAHFVLTAVDQDAGQEFLDQLRDGAGLLKTSPVLHLRNRLLGDDSLNTNERLYLTFRAWLHWREGKRFVGSRTGLQLPRMRGPDGEPIRGKKSALPDVGFYESADGRKLAKVLGEE